MFPVSGYLRKMHTRPDDPVSYQLEFNDQRIDMNPLIGQQLVLEHSGRIVCINCQKRTKTSFSQGYCYACFRRLAECDQCVMSPEKCHYHEGTCRDPEWGRANCMQQHYVYLANSSGVKVGITRERQISTRWMDQGAIQGLAIIRVATRQLAGLVESALRQFVSDRTSWQKMLKGDIKELDLAQEWCELKPLVQAKLDELQALHGSESIEYLSDETATRITYPVTWHPTKVVSLNFDKTPVVSGELKGIKGQYLIFDTGVINIRKFTAYEVELRDSA